jgi:hypothetical protein
MTFRRLIGCSAAMSNADARDIVFRAPARRSQCVFITRRDGEKRAESRAIFESGDLAATVYSVIDLRTHFSITSAIWSEFFSSIIMWPLP